MNLNWTVNFKFKIFILFFVNFVCIINNFILLENWLHQILRVAEPLTQARKTVRDQGKPQFKLYSAT